MRVLFAGPTIFGLDFDKGAFDVRAPAGCGDILSAVFDGAKVIGLIDGVFATEPSVWHKEILYALEAGVRVYGAASMGALRAAECDHFGMIGVGRIYADYRDGVRTSDADVALLHGPAEMAFRPLTFALVDVEATAEEGVARSILTPDRASALLQAARAVHFAKRTWSGLAAAAGIPRPTLEECKVERKAEDARALIDVARNVNAARTRSNSWSLNRTKYLSLLEGQVRGRLLGRS